MIYIAGRPIFNDIAMSGTWTVSGTVTLPAFTAGGTVTLGTQLISGLVTELWLPVTAHHAPSEALQDVGNGVPAALLDGLSEQGVVSFAVPADYASLVSAVLVIYGRVTNATANLDIASVYAANGEARATHTGSDSTTTYNITDGNVLEIDVATILTAIAANDVGAVTLTVGTAGHNCALLGMRIRYKR